jgi:hypothetical protein
MLHVGVQSTCCSVPVVLVQAASPAGGSYSHVSQASLTRSCAPLVLPDLAAPISAPFRFASEATQKPPRMPSLKGSGLVERPCSVTSVLTPPIRRRIAYVRSGLLEVFTLSQV